MSFKKIFDSYFKYEPQNHYQFTIPDTQDSIAENGTTTNNSEEKVNVFPTIQKNLEYLRTKYNLLINSDVIIRQFTLNARGKQYDAFIAYIDGMVDSKIMDEFILKPLMVRSKNNLFDSSQNKIISESTTNNVTVRKVKRFDLSNYLMGCLMPQNALKEVSDFSEIASRNKFTVIALYL